MNSLFRTASEKITKLYVSFFVREIPTQMVSNEESDTLLTPNTFVNV